MANVTAVITVDAEAMGGGSGYAHRVQLPEGSMMAEVFVADILASMEGLTPGPSDAFVQARDSEAPPGPPPESTSSKQESTWSTCQKVLAERGGISALEPPCIY